MYAVFSGVRPTGIHNVGGWNKSKEVIIDPPTIQKEKEMNNK